MKHDPMVEIARLKAIGNAERFGIEHAECPEAQKHIPEFCLEHHGPYCIVWGEK